MTSLNLGLIGNCAFSALIDENGRICWCCLPCFDGDPVFSSMLNGEDPEGGYFDIEVMSPVRREQSYLKNTAILRTVLHDADGSALEIIDFAPRYYQFERQFRPMILVRQLRPLIGTPRIRIKLRPTFNYNSRKPDIARGSNHCRYLSPDLSLRLTTDLPVSFVLSETPFLLQEPGHLILGADESLTESVPQTARTMFEETCHYWQEWSRGLSIPFEWQDQVIRAAIALKLSNHEETGAIVAAMTTSVPEFAHSQRNWDYRFCWLRDAYFVVNALNRLGATRTMEHHLRYISNIVAKAEDGFLQPVYGLSLDTELIEKTEPALRGYRGMGPVRVGNLAYLQKQHDVFGSAILASTQSFFDQRLARPGDGTLYERLEKLGQKAVELYDQPDAGLWELRNSSHVHTYSAVMCWAACDRLAKVATRLGRAERAAYWRQQANVIREVINDRAWNADLNTFVATFGGDTIDASLLLLHDLGFIAAGDSRFIGTVEAVERSLRHGDHLYRYVVEDDFGKPETAFNVCTFWFISALAAIGRRDDARRLFEVLLTTLNPLGLMSEDIEPQTGELWGNFPQTYSLVGLITSAMRLSKRWEDVL